MSDTNLTIRLGIDGSSASKQITELNKELKTLDKQINSLDTSTDDYGENISNMGKKADLTKTKIEGLEAKLKAQNTQLSKAETRLQKAKEEYDNLKNSGEATGEELQKASKKVENAQTAFNNLTRNIGDTERALDAAKDQLAELSAEMANAPFKALSSEFESMSGGLDKLASLTAPISAAFSGMAVAGVTAFIDMEGELANLQNKLNLTDEEAKKLYDTARTLSSDGFGDFNEVLNTLANVKKQLGDTLDESQLEGFAKSIQAINSAFETDTSEVLRTVQVLIKNFGIDGEKALNLIAKGFQDGLNYSGDFLDTLN